MVLFLSFGQMSCGDGDKSQGSAQSRDTEKGADSTPAGAAGSGGTSSAQAGESGSDSSTGTESAEAAEPGTFSHIYEMAFRTCRTQCHGMGFSMLDMKTRDMAYSQLVDHDSNPGNMKCAPLGLKRVKPGSPDESLLYLKLDIHSPCGQQMPPGGQLTQAFRDEVRDWIANGAKDD